MPRRDSVDLQKVIKAVGARWKAVAKAKRTYALGYTPGPTEPSLEMGEVLSYLSYQNFMTTANVGARPYPASFDWRNVGGKNYVTPAKDQLQCGSCVSFGCCSTVEANVRVHMQNPDLDLDLSEADLFFCHDGVSGGSCAGGWQIDPALMVFITAGVPDEKCFPYTAKQQPCKRCTDWKKRVTKIKAFHKITVPGDMKLWLSKYGPLVTRFSVYQDFYSYQSGVYHHVSGPFKGGHCVSCVGYDDSGRYWICKNSWGRVWGDYGFFKIGYGQVGIDAMMWAVPL